MPLRMSCWILKGWGNWQLRGTGRYPTDHPWKKKTEGEVEVVVEVKAVDVSNSGLAHIGISEWGVMQGVD